MTATINHVLVAVDGSAASARAAELALTIAAQAGADVTFLHASIEHATRLFSADPDRPDSEEVIAREVPPLAAASRMAQDAGVEARLDLVGEDESPSHIVSAIIGIGAAREADLIVVGSRGLGRFRGLLGSVSQELLEQSQVPVLVVHAPDE